jgi:phage gp16-like protein
MVDSTKSIDRADRQQATEKRRKALVAKVKIAQKQLGMDDDTYRAFLEGVTGKRSASILKVWELENAMKAMRAKGFKDKPAKSAGTRPQADDEQSRLIRSLWLQLHEAGKVRDPGERALIHWVRGQFKSSDGIEALQWLSVRQKRRIIEQLKQWLAR